MLRAIINKTTPLIIEGIFIPKSLRTNPLVNMVIVITTISTS